MKFIFLFLMLLSSAVFAEYSNPGGGSGNTLGLSCSTGQVPSWSGLGFTTCLSAAGSGTVTSVGLADSSTTPIYTITNSPITAAGNLTLTLTAQVKNLVFAGPVAGSNAQPSMRALVGADLPLPGLTALGGVEAIASVSHQWLNSISTSGVPALSQPGFSDLSGNILVSQMNSGTSASSTTYWRGDGTWATPAGGGGGTWGSITGTLSSQTDLNTALNAKAATASPTFTGQVILPGVQYNHTTTAISYTTLASDYYVGVSSTSAARTITLVSASTAGAGATQIIKDESGGAATHNIMVSASTIDGASSISITANYGVVRVYSNGSNWFSF